MPCASRKRQHVQSRQSVIFDRAQERARFVSRRGSHLSMRHAGRPHEARDVAPHEPGRLGVAEHATQEPVDVTYGPWRATVVQHRRVAARQVRGRQPREEDPTEPRDEVAPGRGPDHLREIDGS